MAPPSAKPWELPKEYGFGFGAQARTVFHGSNFSNHSLSLSDRQESHSLGKYRLRTWVGLFHKERRDHGAYVQLQFGGIGFGANREFSKTKQGGDEVGVSLRRGYLWYKPKERALLRVGVLDWQDRFNYRPAFKDPQWSIDSYDTAPSVLASSVWDFQVAGVEASGKLGELYHYRLGAYALEQGDKTFTGRGSASLFALDLDRSEEDLLLGGSLYYLDDRGDYSYGTFGGPKVSYAGSSDLWVGLRAAKTFGKWQSLAFLIYNRGETSGPSWRHAGWAAGLGASMETERRRFYLQAKFSTGNDGSDPQRSDEFRTIAQSERDNLGAQSYWSDLALSSPRGPNDVSNLGLGLQNRGLGLWTLQASVEQRLRADLRASFALGWLRAAENNPANGSREIGVETRLELNWKMAGALGMDVGGAYLWSGDFFKLSPTASSPRDLFALYLRFQLEF